MMKWIHLAAGGVAGTFVIVVLALKRPAFALYALERQCRKYGHVLGAGGSVCERCLRTVAQPAQRDEGD